MHDTRLSSAIHMLILVSEAEAPMSSAQIATSIGTSAAAVRRLASSLHKGGIISGRRGVTGFTLEVDPRQLTLLDVYRAACDADEVHVFDVHCNPSDECIVGRHIQQTLGATYAMIDSATEGALQSITLADCIKTLRKEAIASGDIQPGKAGLA